MRKIENCKIQSHHPQGNTKISSWKPLWEKNQLEGEAALLSFLWYGNNASTKENALSMELPETCGLLGCYKTLTPSIMLFYGTKYNNIEWNPLSS
jgi:hypothetical protein